VSEAIMESVLYCICQELINNKAHETDAANFIHFIYSFTSVLKHITSLHNT